VQSPTGDNWGGWVMALAAFVLQAPTGDYCFINFFSFAGDNIEMLYVEGL
jgi:hypothetical protein